MKRHKKGFLYTHTKIEKAEEENFFGDKMVFQYWFFAKKIVAMERLK